MDIVLYISGDKKILPAVIVSNTKPEKYKSKEKSVKSSICYSVSKSGCEKNPKLRVILMLRQMSTITPSKTVATQIKMVKNKPQGTSE